MRKNRMKKAALTLSLLTALGAMPVQAKSLGDGLFRIDRYDVFTLFDASVYPHEKRVVTEVAKDGTFCAENVSDFLRSTGLYEITEVRTEADVQGEIYERELCYTFLPDQAEEGYWEEEQLTPPLLFLHRLAGRRHKSDGRRDGNRHMFRRRRLLLHRSHEGLSAGI